MGGEATEGEAKVAEDLQDETEGPLGRDQGVCCGPCGELGSSWYGSTPEMKLAFGGRDLVGSVIGWRMLCFRGLEKFSTGGVSNARRSAREDLDAKGNVGETVWGV